MNALHQYINHPLEFTLTTDGILFVKNLNTGVIVERPWFKDKHTKQPWLVKTRKSFKGLISIADRDGDYDDLK